MTQLIATHGWDNGPIIIYLLLTGTFRVGAVLSETCSELFQKLCVQTAAGQQRASKIYADSFEKSMKTIALTDWGSLCAASGLDTREGEIVATDICVFRGGHRYLGQ